MMCRHVLSVVLAVAGTVSAAFGSEVETDSLKPYPLFRPVPAHLEDGKRHLQLVPSIAVTRGGRLWVTWIAGGRCEDDDNALVLVTSGDGGKSWSKPLLAIDQPGPLRVLDPGVWTDPEGRVWLFWGQTWSFWDGRCGLWARQAVDPENPATEWANPHRLCDGYMKNKPTILKDGRWLLPVEVMAQMGPVCGTEFGLKPNEGPQAHPMPQYRSGVNVFVSSDVLG